MFNIGDRVIATTDCDDNLNIVGIVGTIRCMGSSSTHLGVEFDNDVGGHDGFGTAICNGKSGHCWYVNENELDFVNYLKGEDLLKILEGNRYGCWR